MLKENLQLGKLTEIFRQTGAKNPGSQASSQMNESICDCRSILTTAVEFY